MIKGIIYYTDGLIQEPIRSIVQQQIMKVNLPIVSVSLNTPLEFGTNKVFYGSRGYVTMVHQILIALEMSITDYVFFCEHDVLYPPSHFEFIPSQDNIFYYNSNVWRWKFGSSKAIRYDRMLPLSCLCVNRKFALAHYKYRMEKILEEGTEIFSSNEPSKARKWGYEPGTKKKKRGGITDDDFDTWSSQDSVIDIRHEGTFSPPKVTLESFRHAPVNWQEIDANKIPYWDLKSLFNL